jgi:transketolase
MRDAFLESLYEKMKEDNRLFLLSADFGAPTLDKIRADFPQRFINVGIAEQNLINVGTGLSLEGYTVFCYAIACFITMRCYEQIRIDLAILSQLRKLNVNLIGVGAGMSYDVSGPSHHCLEDLSIMATLPNLEVFSPSDYLLAQTYLERAIANQYPKYMRLDSKPHNAIPRKNPFDFEVGFDIVRDGKKVCIVSTGYMTHKAIQVAAILQEKNIDISVIDCFLVNRFQRDALARYVERFDHVVTMEEGIMNSGGLDSALFRLVNVFGLKAKVTNFGIRDKYSFEMGSRESIHSKIGLGTEEIVNKIIRLYGK